MNLEETAEDSDEPPDIPSYKEFYYDYKENKYQDCLE